MGLTTQRMGLTTHHKLVTVCAILAALATAQTLGSPPAIHQKIFDMVIAQMGITTHRKALQPKYGNYHLSS